MKRWYASKTLWVNAIAGGLVTLEANTGILQPLLPANTYALIAVVLPVVNMALRTMTTSALTK